MTKTEALALFRELFPSDRYVIPAFISTTGRRIPESVDVVMRREDWNNFTDSLCKDKCITTRQYESWTNPF